MYSYQSQLNLKPKSFSFYPLHIKLLNVSEETRIEQITSGRSFVAYLSLAFLPMVGDNESYEYTFYLRDNTETKALSLAKKNANVYMGVLNIFFMISPMNQ